MKYIFLNNVFNRIKISTFGYIFILTAITTVMYAATLRGVLGNPSPEEIVRDLKASGMPFESSLARGRFAQTMAIAEDGRFDLINGKEQIPLPDLGYYDGHFYSLFAPGISIFSVPVYNLGKLWNMSQLSIFSFWALVAIFDGILIFLIARAIQAPKWASLFAGLSYTLGTTAWPYAISLAQHNTTVLFLLLIIFSRLYAKKKWWGFFLGWLAYSLAISIDYINALLLLPAITYLSLKALTVKFEEVGIKLKLHLSILCGFFVFLVINLFHGYYNQINFGNPTTIGTSVFQHIKTPEEVEQLQQSSSNESSDQNTKNVVNFFEAKNLPQGLRILLLSKGRSILLFSPIVLVGILGLVKIADRKKKVAITLAATIAVDLIFYSAFGDPWGGWEYGPRYLIPSMAALSICVAVALQHMKKFKSLIITWIIFLYSSGVNLLGALTTNQLPADREAIPLNLPYTYLYNLSLLVQDKSYVFAYQSFINKYISAWQYGLYLFVFLMIVSFVVIFFLPNIEREKKP